MSEQKASLKVEASAEIAELVAYTKAVTDAHAATSAFMGSVGAPSGGGGGGAASGSAPPSPAPAHQQAGAPAGAPPARPGSGVIGATNSGPWGTATVYGAPPPTPAPAGAPPISTAPLPPGAPPPPPLRVASPYASVLPRDWGQMPYQQQAAAAATPPPPAPAAVAGGGTAGGGAPAAASRGYGPSGSVLGGAQSFMSHTASTAIGVGLGTSLMGLPMAAINRYMTLSTVLEQVNQKFRDASEGAEMFGTGMGYGIARSAQLAETLGGVTNRIDAEEGQRMLGFARHTGSDPSAALRSLGTLSYYGGRSLGDADLARVLGTAESRGMDQGRLEEFLSRVEQTTREQFTATGKADIDTVMSTLALPKLLFQSGDRRLGDESLTQGLQSVMTSGGAMQSYMMRAIGYGQAGGPDYIEMRKRLEAGIFDARNVESLFGSFQDRGMGTGAQFRAIESVAGGALKAHQIEALVKGLGSKEGLDRFRELAFPEGGEADDAMSVFSAMLGDKDRAAFDRGGMKGLGQRSISAGERYENRIESMFMDVGSTLAQGIPNMQDAIASLGRTMTNLIGDIGPGIERLTGLVERAAIALEHGTEGPFGEGRKFIGSLGEDIAGGDPSRAAYRYAQGVGNRLGVDLPDKRGSDPFAQPSPEAMERARQTQENLDRAMEYERGGGGGQ